MVQSICSTKPAWACRPWGRLGLRSHARSGILSGVARPKPLVWVGSSKEDLTNFPEEVKRVMGFALYLAQSGGKHPDAKPLKGNRGGGLLEVVEDFDGNTFRSVYTVKFEGVVYALHAFQKKSKKGIKTPKRELDLVKGRLKRAQEIHAQRTVGSGADDENQA